MSQTVRSAYYCMLPDLLIKLTPRLSSPLRQAGRKLRSPGLQSEDPRGRGTRGWAPEQSNQTIPHETRRQEWMGIHWREFFHPGCIKNNMKIKAGQNRGFHGSSVVKNLPANAGDMGSIPDPERSLTLQSNWATTDTEPVLQSLESATRQATALSSLRTTEQPPLPAAAKSQHSHGRISNRKWDEAGDVKVT